MQHNARQQQVAVHAGIMRHNGIGQRQQADDVFQQAADPRMMQRLGCGSDAQLPRDHRVIEKAVDQRAQIGVRERRHHAAQLRPHFFNIARGCRQKVRRIMLAFGRLAQLAHHQLKAPVCSD